MVYEMYRLKNGNEETGVFAIIQTISMRVCVIGIVHTVIEWMQDNGLTSDNGWELEKAYPIDYHDYNKLISF